jgi:hypothetical protein
MNIYTKNGLVSAYGFACGYVESYSNLEWLGEAGNYDNVYHLKRLFFEGSCYHVEYYKDGKLIASDSFYKIGEARAKYETTYFIKQHHLM